jgi:threonine aldolase
MKYIDLRSDTVTKPDQPMLDAMMSAALGDDVYGEDPTVNALQQKCAKLTGKEDALFVPTGVMGNQLAIKAHTSDGDEVIVEAESHIFNYETAAGAIISRVQMLPLKGNYGVLTTDDIAKYIRPDEYHFPKTKLICLENTHNRSGGTIVSIDAIRSVSELAKKNGIKMHLDGARIFNASVETKISIKEYANHFDSISFCFSKGLGAPVGSILCGSKEVIKLAKKWRKILGGGMRQVGIIAGAAIYALDNNVERLKTDNDRAKSFAKAMSESGNYDVDIDKVQTNLIIFKSKKYTQEEFIAKMREKGILTSSGSYDFLRIVFHKDLSEEDVQVSKKAFLN